MKKILISLLAAAGVFAACDKIEKIQIPAEDDVVPPVLKEVPESIVVTGEEENGKLEAEFIFTPADFKQKAAGTYTLYGVYGGETLSIVSLSASGNAKVSYTAFNKGVMTAFPKIVPGKEITLEVKVGVTIGNTYGTIFSNSKTLKVTTYPLKARVTDYPEYEDVSEWGVTGNLSAHKLNWGNEDEDKKIVEDLVMYTNGTLHLCEKVTIKAGELFKFRKDNKWDDNLGGEGADPFPLKVGVEVSVTAGGKNFTVEEDGVYDLFLDPVNNKAKVVKNSSDVNEPMDIPAVVRAYYVTDEGTTDLTHEITPEGELSIKTIPAGAKPFPVIIEFTLPEKAKIAAVSAGDGETAFEKAAIVAGGVAVAFWAPDNEDAKRTLSGTVSFSEQKKKATLTVNVLQLGKGETPDPETLEIPAAASAALVLSETESEALTIDSSVEGEITVKTVPAGPDGNTVLITFTNPEGVAVSAVDKGDDFTSAEVAAEGAAAKFIVPANETEAEVTRIGTVTFAKGELTASLTVKVLQAAKESAPDPNSTVTLYFYAATPVTKACLCSSKLGTETWPGTEMTKTETIAGGLWYKFETTGEALWDKSINFYFHGGEWATSETTIEFTGSKDAYYFVAEKDKVARLLDGRPADWAFESKFGIDWTLASVASAGGRTSENYDAITILKATADATTLYLYFEVKRAPLYSDDTYAYSNLAKIFLGDENSTQTTWQWNTKYTKSFNSWIQTDGVPKLTTFECDGLDSQVVEHSKLAVDADIPMLLYELAIPRSFDACLQGTSAYVSMEINKKYVVGSEWLGEDTQVGFAPACWGDALSVTLPAYVAPTE